MTRPFFKTTLDDLEKMARENLHNGQILGDIRSELSYRTTDRAKQLERELLAIAEGRLVAPPGPPRKDRPDDQGELGILGSDT